MLLPGSTGLKMSRVSGEPGTTQQDAGICCELRLTNDITKYHREGSPRLLGAKAGDKASVAPGCFASVRTGVTEADRIIKESDGKKDSLLRSE